MNDDSLNLSGLINNQSLAISEFPDESSFTIESILVAIAIIAFSIFCMSGCSTFKPGTLERMEVIAVEDELKMAEDEIKELEGDIIDAEQKPVRKKHASN